MAPAKASVYGNSAAEEVCDCKEERLDCMDTLLLIGRTPMSSREGCLGSGKLPKYILSQTGCAAILMLMLLDAKLPLLPQHAILTPRLCIAFLGFISIWHTCPHTQCLLPPNLGCADFQSMRPKGHFLGKAVASMPLVWLYQMGPGSIGRLLLLRPQ